MYRLTGDWSLGQQVSLVANDSYWGGAPTPKRLVFKFIREPSTRVAELLKGTAHVAEAVSLPQIPVLRRGVNTDVIAMKGARVLFQSINLSKPPLNNVRVRQAMNYAINREVVVKNLLQNYGQAHAGLFSPGWMGYSNTLRPYAFDVPRARQLLAEAGLASGFEFEWQMTDGVFTKDREIAEAVASQLRQAGITARLRVTERATIFQNMFAGSFDVISGQWPTTSDPDRYLQWLFIRTKGAADSREVAPVVRMMEEARTIVDPARRAQKYQEISQIAHDQAFLMYIHVQDELYGVNTRTGWAPHPVRGLSTQHWYALHRTIRR
jgi:peptide/nickel transport system substrate-binding protein